MYLTGMAAMFKTRSFTLCCDFAGSSSSDAGRNSLETPYTWDMLHILRHLITLLPYTPMLFI
jgi:hypothetical protein